MDEINILLHVCSPANESHRCEWLHGRDEVGDECRDVRAEYFGGGVLGRAWLQLWFWV